jgi:hypothetical protein
MQRSLTFAIPTEDPDSEGEFPLAASHKGALFEVAYSLKIFVKHDSVTEFGEGHCVTLPIRILGPMCALDESKWDVQLDPLT